MRLIKNDLAEIPFESQLQIFEYLAEKVMTKQIKNVELENKYKFNIEEDKYEVFENNQQIEIYNIYFSLRTLINTKILNKIELMKRLGSLNYIILTEKDEKAKGFIIEEIEEIERAYFV